MTLALASCLAVHAEAENRTPSGVKSAIETMPPQYLAQITRQAQRDSKGILWGEVHDGLVLGIGQIRTSWKSPIWPIIDVYLENRGREMVEGTLLVSSSYIVELDGQSYGTTGFGGPLRRLPPNQRLGPLTIEARHFRRIEKPPASSAAGTDVKKPALTEGTHTLRLSRNYKGKPVLGPEVTFHVSLSPYPMEEAIKAVTAGLKDRDRDVRGSAARSAGELRLFGARAAVLNTLKDTDVWVRRDAAAALGEIGDANTIAPLKELLQDPEMAVRMAAIDGLMKLGEPFEAAWVIPVIQSKKGNEFQNAIWLVRRHAGEKAAPTLIRCLDVNDPSTVSYYNATLTWQIGACGGPQLKYYHDFDGKSTPQQVQHNRKTLRRFRDWLAEHERK
jgi:hypothetical protein